MGYVSNFLNDTIKEIGSISYNGKSYTENDIISVSVGNETITWECFKNSSRDLDWYPEWGTSYIRQDIQILLKGGVIMFLEEYDSGLHWNIMKVPNNIPDKSTTQVKLRPDNYREDLQ